MKKLLYSLMSLVLVFSFFSCNSEEDYENVHVSYSQVLAATAAKASAKDTTAELSASIMFKDFDGNELSNVDMGKSIILIDNSQGNTGRTWEIEERGTTVTSDDVVFAHVFAKPGTYSVKLTINKGEETQSVTRDLVVNQLPVLAKFTTEPMVSDEGTIEIMQGSSIKFTSLSEGVPDAYLWTFEGAETTTSSEANPTVKYNTVGTFKVSLKASRDDGDGQIAENTMTKEAFVVVKKLMINIIECRSLGNKVTVLFDQPIKSVDLSKVSLSITTKAGATLTPDLLAGTVSAENDSLVSFNISGEQVYSDDVAKIILAENAVIDATEVGTFEAKTDYCIYSKDVLFSDGFDTKKWYTGTQGEDANWNYVEDPVNQGKYAVFLEKSSKSVCVANDMSFALTAGTNFTIQYDAMKGQNASSKGFEMRFGVSNDGGERYGDAGGGHWFSAGAFGAYGTWKTMTGTYTATKDAPTMHIYLLFYGEGSCYIDNLKVYIANPRP